MIDQHTPHGDKDLLAILDRRLNRIRTETSDRTPTQDGPVRPGPGSVFILGGKTPEAPEPVLLLLADRLPDNRLRCLKMSWEILFAGPYDLLLDPDDWTGGYAAMIEAWNAVELPAANAPAAVAEAPSEWTSRALTLHGNWQKGEPPDPDLAAYCGPSEGEEDARRAFANQEQNAAASVGGVVSAPPANILTFVDRKARIRRRYRIDQRAGFEMPYELALTTPGARVTPARILSLMSGEWDVVESKGRGGVHCVFPSGIATAESVDRVALEKVQWVEINRKIFSALSEPDVSRKMRKLSEVLAETDQDPYAALTLSWVLFFRGETRPASELARQAEQTFPRPEFGDIARRAKEIMEKGAPPGDPFVDVWRLRCAEPDPKRRVGRLKALFLRTGSGYAAFETAIEYRYMGSLGEGQPDYRLYDKVRSWCERALSAAVPLPGIMRPWPEEIMNKIAPTAPEVRAADAGRPDYYAPFARSG